MTKRELIEKLSALPDDAEVYVISPDDETELAKANASVYAIDGPPFAVIEACVD